jgi:hypothetical protein
VTTLLVDKRLSCSMSKLKQRKVDEIEGVLTKFPIKKEK